MPLFFGSSIISALLVVVAFVRWNEDGTGLTLMAGAVYFIGMFVCTVIFNVPLNNSLAKLDPNSVKAPHTWAHYLKTWTN